MKEHGIHVGIGAHGTEGLDVGPDAAAIDRREQVDRVRHRHPLRIQGGQRLARRRGQIRELEADRFDQIGGDDAGATATGQHGDAAAALRRGLRERCQRPAHVEHLVEVVRFDDTDLRQRAADQGAVAGEAGGMTERRLRPGGGGASLEHDDGLAGRTAQVHEPPAVGNRLEIHSDGRRVGIGDQVFEEVALVDVDLVADGARLAHPHGGVAHDVDEEPGGQEAALHDEGDVAGDEAVIPDRFHDEGEHVPADGIHQAHAVRSPQPDPRLARDAAQLFLQRLALGAAFGEAGRLNDDPLDAAFGTPSHFERHARGRNENQREVHGIWDVENGRVAAQPLDLCIRRVDWVNRPGEARDQILQDAVARLRRPRGGADERDALRVEKEVHSCRLSACRPRAVTRGTRAPARAG